MLFGKHIANERRPDDHSISELIFFQNHVRSTRTAILTRFTSHNSRFVEDSRRPSLVNAVTMGVPAAAHRAHERYLEELDRCEGNHKSTGRCPQ
jgi:hypothetical protein